MRDPSIPLKDRPEKCNTTGLPCVVPRGRDTVGRLGREEKRIAAHWNAFSTARSPSEFSK
jgi:hypothetical protein